MHEPDLIDHYVFGLWRRLPLRQEVAARILEEVEGHLRASAERGALGGASREDSQRHAIESFGSLDDIAQRLMAANRPGGIARARDVLNSLDPLYRLAILFMVLVLPWNLDCVRGGADVAVPLALGALMLGQLPRFIVRKRATAWGTALAALMMLAVLSFPLAEICRKVHELHALGGELWFGPSSAGASWLTWGWYAESTGAQLAHGADPVVSLRDVWTFVVLVGLYSAIGTCGSALGSTLRWLRNSWADRRAAAV